MRLLLAALLCVIGLTAEAAITQTFTTTNTPAGTTNGVAIVSGMVSDAYLTNTYARSPYGFSLSLQNFWFMQKALNSYQSHRLKLMWFGDSTGGDSIAAFQSFLDTNYVFQTDPQGFNVAQSAYFDVAPNSPGVGQLIDGSIAGHDTNWWGGEFSLTNGAGNNQTFGIRNSQAVRSDRIQFWYIAAARFGTATLYTSPSSSSNTWTLRATVDTTAGNLGLRMTNIALPAPDNYYVKVSNSVAGTESRVVYVWPTLNLASANSAQLFDGHVSGQDLTTFITMGTNSIASLITNFQPDVIFFQQTKSVASMSTWQNVAGIFATYATNTDIVPIQSQEAKSAVTAADPANGGQFQLPVQREVAITNGWPFIDLRSEFYNWTNIVNAGFDNGTGIHFTSTGQQISGQSVIQQMGLWNMLANAGALKPIPNSGAWTNTVWPANLALWYDADSATNGLGTVTKVLPDLSTNHFNAKNINVGSETAYWTNEAGVNNGYGYIKHLGDGGGIFRTNFNAFAPTNYFVMVMRSDNSSACNFFDPAVNSAGVNLGFLQIADSTWALGAGGGNIQRGGFTTNRFLILELCHAGNSANGSFINVNGVRVLTGTDNNASLNGLTIGSAFDNSANSKMSFAELLEWNRQPTDGERAAILGKLSQHFNLPISYSFNLVQTNWVPGIFITNFSGAQWTVGCVVSREIATNSIGAAELDISVDETGGTVLNKRAIIRETALIPAYVHTNQDQIVWTVPNGAVFSFTNADTGTHVSRIVAGTGFLKVESK